MLGILDAIREAESLPIEKRAFIVDSLLRSLNPPDSDIDKKWISVARRRLKELRSGQVDSISGEDMFAKIQQHFAL